MDKSASNEVRVLVARKILTMNPHQPVATHVAIRDGKILSVGTLEDMRQWADVEPDTTLGDKVLMPGLVEGHSHLIEGAMWREVYVGHYERPGPDGKRWPGLKTLDAVIKRLQEAERQIKDPDTPLLAWGFDPIFFRNERLTVRQLDRVCATRPIAILHASVHLMNVNTPMLDTAGIDEDTDVDGIVRDANGRLTGELQEFAAMSPVYRVIGDRLSPSAADNPDAVWNFGKVAQLAGVTTATDLLNELSDKGIRRDQCILRTDFGDDHYVRYAALTYDIIPTLVVADAPIVMADPVRAPIADINALRLLELVREREPTATEQFFAALTMPSVWQRYCGQPVAAAMNPTPETLRGNVFPSRRTSPQLTHDSSSFGTCPPPGGRLSLFRDPGKAVRVHRLDDGIEDLFRRSGILRKHIRLLNHGSKKLDGRFFSRMAVAPWKQPLT